MPKYVFVNGVMREQTQQLTQSQAFQSSSHIQALAIVSSTQDIMDASQAQEKATGMPMQVAPQTIESMQYVQDDKYLQKFKTQQSLDGGDILDGLSDIFAQYEVPIGLLNKLIALSEYKLNFIIDDSGSMNEASDLRMNQACPQIRQSRDPQGRRALTNQTLTRWEEAEDRLHIMFAMLAYLPIEEISISFLNRTETLALSHTGKTPEQFAQEVHQNITQIFNSKPAGSTPLYRKLAETFSKTTKNTMHYLFTDGIPSDASVDQVKKLVLHRNNPKMNPLTFMSCTSEDKDAEWMKEIEEAAQFTAELDDFISERNEVLKDQGPSFPFTRGFWLICQLVAAINPYDLDAMDESVPFTKKTMNDLMGRNITIEEYRQYFRTNPNAPKYSHLQQQFEREDVLAYEIINHGAQSVRQPQSNFQPGYPVSGQYPNSQPYPQPQNPYLYNQYSQAFFNQPTNSYRAQNGQQVQPSSQFSSSYRGGN